MSFGNTFENDILKLILNGTSIANLADNAAAAPLGNLYLALHTADPGEAGDQTTSETNYTGYARVAVARSTGGFTASTTGSSSLVNNADFPAGTGGAGTITHFSLGIANAGAGKIIMSGAVTPNITVGNGIIPRLTTATSFVID